MALAHDETTTRSISVGPTRTVRQLFADIVALSCDIGATNSGARLEYLVGGSPHGTPFFHQLLDPAWLARSTAGVMTADGLPIDTAPLVGGPMTGIDGFRIVDRDAAIVYMGNVGTSGSDLNLSSTTIQTGEIVRLNQLQYTASP